MGPPVAQRPGVEISQQVPKARDVEKPRSLRHQQPHGQLNRRHVGGHVQLGQQVQQIGVVLEAAPGRERNECRRQEDAGVPGEGDGPDEVAPGMPLGEQGEDPVVHRFGRRGDEQAAGVGKGPQVAGMQQNVFDLDGHVVGQVREFRMQRPNQTHGVAGPVEEIRVAEGDMARPRRHLVADVCQDHAGVHHAEAPAVDGHHRTVPAEMLAPAAGFRIAGRQPVAFGRRHVSVTGQIGQATAVGHAKPQLGVGNRRPAWGLCAVIHEPAGERRQLPFELAAEDGADPEPPEKLLVQRRVQAVATDMRRRIEADDPRDELRGQARRRVHGKVEGDQARFPDRPFIEAFHGQVDARHFCALVCEPSRGRGQAEGLMAQIVCGQKDDLHLGGGRGLRVRALAGYMGLMPPLPGW